MRRPLLRCFVIAAAIGMPAAAVSAAKGKVRPTPVAAFQDLAEEDVGEVEPEIDLEPGFFHLDEWIPPPLRDALDAYQEGRSFAALGALDGVLAAREPEYAVDDAQFLRGLALEAVGWDDLAVPALSLVAESKTPGPYSVLALLELVEIHARAERWKAIADLWQRAIDRPVRAGDARGKRIRDLLWQFGELRPATPERTRRENKLLSAPEELAVILEKRRERASDRLLYRSGQALFRIGRHEDSIRALLAIGIKSPYYPYARYSIAQNELALGRHEEGWRTLVRLGRYPKITPEEKVLGSRMRVTQAAIYFQSDETEKGIRLARAIPDDDPEAPRARLLLTNALLDDGQPALALAYGRDEPATLPEDVARRALTLGAAYAAIGDKQSAAKELRGGAEALRMERSEESVDRLRGLAERAVAERRTKDAATRRQLADGMRIVLAHDGPWNLGTLLRRLRAALGAGAYRVLSRGSKIVPEKPVSTADPWVAYLASARRPAIELGLERASDLDAKGGSTEQAFRALNAMLLAIERSPEDEAGRRAAARKAVAFVSSLRTEAKLAIPPLRLARSGSVALEAAAYRRKLAQAARPLAAKRSLSGSLGPARAAAALARDWVDREIQEFLRERGEKLHALEFELEVALSQNIVRGANGEQPD